MTEGAGSGQMTHSERIMAALAGRRLGYPQLTQPEEAQVMGGVSLLDRVRHDFPNHAAELETVSEKAQHNPPFRATQPPSGCRTLRIPLNYVLLHQTQGAALVCDVRIYFLQ